MRARTTFLAAVVSGAILVVAGFILLVGLEHSLTHGADVVSEARLQEVRVRAESGTLEPELADAGDGVVQVVDASGTVVAASPNVADQPPVTRFVPSSRHPSVRVVRGAPDDNETEDYRIWGQRVSSPNGEQTVFVGASLESIKEATSSLRHALYVGIPLTLAVLVASTWLLVGRALRPVEAIRAEVVTISGDRLNRRVPVPDVDDEVGRLARTMNDMLGRLEDSSRRQRDFVADASHELMSPLAASRALIEAPGDTADAAGARRQLLAENSTMERLVKDLLFLARGEEGREPHAVPTDLDDIVLEEATRLRPSVEATVDTSQVSAAPVLGDADQLRRTVRNLLENAARHATSTITVQLRSDDDGVRLDVIDDGPGIVLGDHERVFDRFYRSDPARARGSGTGLGLAIARAVAERHGGTLTLTDDHPGAHFVLRLPHVARGGSAKSAEATTGAEVR